jgi:type IV pilus assembly protein PilM
MAQRVIGLDVGTNAVRAVEVELGDHPQVRRMGQVALGAGAVVDGEVVDVQAVALALRRLWTEARFTSRDARVGMSSPRVIVRTIEMPPMAHDELISTITLQLDEYVPLPPEDTVFGVRPLGWSRPGQTDQQMLLAATHRDAVVPLLAAMAAADLRAVAVDVVPAALALALSPGSISADSLGWVDVIVSIGAATLVVVAARQGEAVFSRTLTSVCGRKVTDRIARDLGIDVVEAERHKRMAAAIDPESTSIASAIADVIAEVQATLDFYGDQTDALPVRRLLLTGGGSLLTGLPASLSDEFGMPVVMADPFINVKMGDTGFEPADLPDVAPYLAAAMGTALAAIRPKDRRIDLTPIKVANSSGVVRRFVGVVGAVLLAGAIGGNYIRTRAEIGDERRQVAAVRADLTEVQAEAIAQQDTDLVVADGPLADASAIAASVAARNVDWFALEAAVETSAATMGVVISSFQGVVDPLAAAAATTGTTHASLGRLTLTATAPEMNAIAGWLDIVAADPRFVEPWVAGLTVIDQADGSVVQFTMDVGVTDLNLVVRPDRAAST